MPAPDPLTVFWSQVQEVYDSELKPEAADIVKEALFATYPPLKATMIGLALRNRGMEFLGNLWSASRRHLARRMGGERMAAVRLMTGPGPGSGQEAGVGEQERTPGTPNP